MDDIFDLTAEDKTTTATEETVSDDYVKGCFAGYKKAFYIAFEQGFDSGRESGFFDGLIKGISSTHEDSAIYKVGQYDMITRFIKSLEEKIEKN